MSQSQTPSYIITDGSRYIYKNRIGKFVPGTSDSMADKFTKSAAEHVLNNQIPRTMRKLFHVQPVATTTLPLPADVKIVTKEAIKENTGAAMLSDNISVWLDRLENLNGLAKDAEARKDELALQLSNIDKELVDLDHYIEFAKFNACQGFKATNMRQQRLKKRRDIKNELFVIGQILGKNLASAARGNIEKAIAGMDGREYAPRVLFELFS